MSDSNYPNSLDTDLEIPRVDKGVTEIDGSVVNSIRDAIFNIQKALGVNIQGNKTGLAERLAVSIDQDGNIKSSALEGIGLATLPINDSHIDSAAAIAETKLDLDHTTQSLKNSLNSTQTNVTNLRTALEKLQSNFNVHTLGQGRYHDGYDIKVDNENSNGVVGLEASTIGDAVNEMASALYGDKWGVSHIDTTLPDSVSHRASHVWVDSSSFVNISSTVDDVQETFEDIDSNLLAQLQSHVDGFHNNGIFKEINSGSAYNVDNPRLTGSSSSYTQDTSIIQIVGVTDFDGYNVKAGDILVVPTGYTDSGSYKIEAVGPRTASEALGGLPALDVDELAVFHVFKESATPTVSIYQPASMSSENAPLACSVRHSETLVDSISVLRPDSARVVSLGFNGAIINGDGYSVSLEVGVGDSKVRGITIPNLNDDRLSGSQASIVDATSVANRINAYVSDPTLGFHFPITAYRVGDEIAIAHNLVGADYTLKVLDGYTANFAMGLDAYGADVLGDTIYGNTNNTYAVNGISLNSINTLVDGYATISSTTDTFTIYQDDGTQVNPQRLGIRAGNVVHITSHPILDMNGSYTIASVTSTTISVFSGEQITEGSGGTTTFDVLISDADVSLNLLLTGADNNAGLIDIYVDQSGKILSAQRLVYDSWTPNVTVIDVSDTFPIDTTTLTQTDNGSSLTYTITEESVVGTAVTVASGFVGTFKLYHTNNIDYLILRADGGSSGNHTTAVTTFDRLNSDEAMLLSTVHFDGVDTISQVEDNRIFGNIDESQISSTFIEIFGERPHRELRSNGVVLGFDSLNMPYVDSLSNMQALPLSGGIAYVNGTRVVVETQKVVLPSFDSNNALTGESTFVVGINQFGTIRAFSDTLGEILTDGYTSSIQFGQILPLYIVTLDSSGLLDTITDIRQFINDLDNKVEIIVDESNNVLGNFRDLAGAFYYARNFPGKERLTVKIINTVNITKNIYVPEGVSLIGTSPYGGQSKIVSSSTSGHLLICEGDNYLANIEIEATNVALNGRLVLVDGSSVVIERCSLKYSGSIPNSNSSDYAIGLTVNATQDVKLLYNRISNVFGGIYGDEGCENLEVTGNHISEIYGEAAETYGIRLGNNTNTVNRNVISNNFISVPTPAGTSSIIGIMFDVEQDIDVVRIENNDIVHENNDTMTHGIKVENESDSDGGKVTNLFLNNNLVDGVGLDSDIFGMYVDDCENVIMDHNILKNIGQVNNANTGDAFIKIASGVDQAKLTDNILEDGYVMSGIDITSGTPDVTVSQNTISNVGYKNLDGTVAKSTVYIRGNVPYSKVTDNELVGTGLIGIYFGAAGNYLQINDNKIKGNFNTYGIRALGSEIDIKKNKLTGMDTTVGIQLDSSTSGCSVMGNSINGDNMLRMVYVAGGSEHQIANNYMNNINNNNTTYMGLVSVSNSMVNNNTFVGAGEYGVNDFASSLTGVSILGNRMSNVSFNTRAVNLDHASTSGCMFLNNDLPTIDTSIIGSSGANLIGINRNYTDTISLSVGSGIISDAYGWYLENNGDYWKIPTGVSGDYPLYFPLTVMPNGSRLASVNVIGSISNASTTYSFEVYKKDLTDTGTPFAASSVGTDIASGAGTFSVTVDTSNEIIDYSTYAYYAKIIITTAPAGAAEHLAGIKINITY